MRQLISSICILVLELLALTAIGQDQITATRLTKDTVAITSISFPQEADAYRYSVQNLDDLSILKEWWSTDESDTAAVGGCNIRIQRASYMGDSLLGFATYTLHPDTITFQADVVQNTEVNIFVEGDFVSAKIEFFNGVNYGTKKYMFTLDGLTPTYSRPITSGEHNATLLMLPHYSGVYVATLTARYPGCTQKIGRLLYLHP